MATEKFIASSVFVTPPTGTPLSFSNGISFDALVNSTTQGINEIVGAFVGDYYVTSQKGEVLVTAASAGSIYLPSAESWADITITNMATEAISVESISGDFNYLGTAIGTTLSIPANSAVRLVRNSANEWAVIPQAQLSVRNVVLTLTAGDILAMNTTPITIVPAIPNCIVEPLSFFWKLNFNTTAYDVTGIGEINLLYDSSSAAVKFFQSTSAACLSSVTTATYVFPKYPYTVAEKLTVNKPLSLMADADPTLGDSTVTVEVLYKITTLA